MRSALFAVAAALAMTTAAAQPLPDELRTAPVTVAEYQQYNEELELVRALARQRSADARIALARLFVERAQSAQAEGQYDLAFRYLIAGARVSPQNSAIFRAGLAQAVHATNDYFQIDSPSWAAFYDAGDGLFLVGRRQNVELWNGRTRSLVRSFAADDRVENEPHQYEARLSADRRRLIVVGDAVAQPVPLRLWDVETGALVRRFDFGAWISEPRFSPNGETFMMRILRGAYDDASGEFQLRRSSDGAELATIRACCRASFSADSRVMVVAARDRLYVVDASTGAAQAEIDLRSLLPAEALRDGWVYVELSPDGRWVLLQQDLSDNSYVVGLSGAEPSVLRLWAGAGPATNPTAGNYVRGRFLGWADASRLLVRIPGDAESLAYVDARSGAMTPTRYADLDATSRALLTRFWEGETSSHVRDPDTGEMTDVPRGTFALSSGFDLVMTTLDNFELHRPGHSDFIVRTLDGAVVARLPGHNLYANHHLIDWSRHAVLSVAGPHVRFWPNDEGHSLWRAPTSAEAASLNAQVGVYTTESSQTHRTAYVRRGDALISILGASPADIERARLNPTPDEIGALMRSAPHDVFGHLTETSFDARGTRVAVTDQQRAGVWDVASGQLVFAAPDLVGDDTFWDVALSPDGRFFAVSRRRVVAIYDLENGRLVRERPLGALQTHFSHDGQSLVSLDRGAITIWSRRTGETTSFLRTTREVSGFALSPDGQVVVVAHGDEWTLWDVATRKKIGELTAASRAGLMRFADDGQSVLAFVARPGESWEVLEWDIRRLVQPLDALMRDACAYYLEERSFSAEEIEADPLIREVWLRDRRGDADVCEGVAPAARN